MGNDLSPTQMRMLEEQSRRNVEKIGVGFGDITRAPGRVVGAYKKLENVPIIGEGIKDAELLPGFGDARDAAELAENVEKHVKSLTGIDVNHAADKVDRFFGYTGNVPEKDRSKAGGNVSITKEEDNNPAYGREHLNDMPPAVDLTPPHFKNGHGATTPHFSLEQQKSWLPSSSNKDIVIS